MIESGEKRLHSLVFSPDGETIAGASLHVIFLWKSSTGEAKLNIKLYDVRRLIFSPDNKIIASVSGIFEICLWDTTTGEGLHKITTEGWIDQPLAFSPDAQRLVYRLDNEIRLWNVSTGEEKSYYTGYDLRTEHLLTEAVFLPDGQEFLIAKHERDRSCVMLIDMVTEEVRQIFEKYTQNKGTGAYFAVAGPVIALSLNGATVAWVSDDETIFLQDTMTNKIIHRLINPSLLVEKLIFSPDGQLLAAIHRESAVSIWRTTTGEQRFCFPGIYVDSIAFSPDGLLFALVNSQHRGVVELWDMDVYQAGMDGCSSETRLGTADKDSLIVSQNPKQDRTKSIKDITFSPDGRTIASTSGDNCVCIWDSTTEIEIRELRHQDPVHKIVYSADSKSIVSLSGSNTILIWHVSSNDRRRLAHQDLNIESIALSPDGQTLASVAFDSIQIWDMSTGQRTQYLKHAVNDLIPSAAMFFAKSRNHASAEFSPNSKMLAAKVGESICVWEVATGKEIQKLQDHSNLILPITPLAFSSDGRMLSALAGLSQRKREALATRQVLVWEVETGIKSSLPLHPGANYCNLAPS
jgi:WD40 repeat protein